MSVVFGDDEPEDGWDIGDPPAVQIQNLILRAELLTGRRLRLSGEPVTILDALAALVAEARRVRLTDVQRVRAGLMAEDIDFVRARI